MAFRHARNCGKCGRYIKSCWCSFYPEKGYHDEGLCDECYATMMVPDMRWHLEDDGQLVVLPENDKIEVQEADPEWKPVRTRENTVIESQGEQSDVRQKAVEVIAKAVHYHAQLDEEDEILGNAGEGR